MDKKRHIILSVAASALFTALEAIAMMISSGIKPIEVVMLICFT